MQNFFLSVQQWSFYSIVCLTNCSHAHFFVLSATLKSFCSSPWVLNGLWINFQQMGLAPHYKMSFSSHAMYFPLSKDVSKHIDGNFRFMTMMINYHLMEYLKRLNCFCHSENLCICQPDFQSPFKVHIDIISCHSWILAYSELSAEIYKSIIWVEFNHKL